jgi:F-type H+-transporting ATPase subunit b
MEAILQAFQLDWKLLLAQIINFALVVGVLGFGVFKPLMKKMSERQQLINQGVDNAQLAKQNLVDAEKEFQKIVSEAKLEATNILKDAQAQCAQLEKRASENAQERVKEVINKGKIQLAEMKLQMISEARDSLAELVVIASEKVINVKMDAKLDDKIIKESLITEK